MDFTQMHRIKPVTVSVISNDILRSSTIETFSQKESQASIIPLYQSDIIVIRGK